MKFPNGWEVSTLGEVGDLYCGQSVSAPQVNTVGRGTLYVTGPEQWDGRKILQNKWTEEPKRLVPDGCIFVTVKGAGVGKTFPGIACSIGRDVYAYKPNIEIETNFIHQAIRYRIAEIIRSARGDIPGLSKEHLADHQLGFPPKKEQLRIVAKLDALTSRLARARAELDKVPVLAERLRINVLRDVFGRSGSVLPHGWALKRIDEIGDVQLGRQRSPKDHHGPNMRSYLRSANITWKGWDLSDVKEMNFSAREFETFHLRPGDVLLNEGSGSAKEVGKPAIWQGEIADVCFQNTLLRVRPHAYSAELLRYALLYLALSGQFIANTKGVNIIHIGKAGLAKTLLPVPPQNEQQDLLARFDAAFARADRLEAEAARARALLDRLESAILAKAFRGELVPQDPNDEPASVLLDRIRAERANAPKAKRGRRAGGALDQPGA